MSRAIALLLVCTAHVLACAVRQQLPVKLFDEAVAGDKLIEPARAEAARLLKSVCVDVTWTLCPVVTLANVVPCAAPARAVELHILTAPITADASETAMGVAVLAGNKGSAGVFLSRVRQTVDSEPGVIGVPGFWDT